MTEAEFGAQYLSQARALGFTEVDAEGRTVWLNLSHAETEEVMAYYYARGMGTKSPVTPERLDELALKLRQGRQELAAATAMAAASGKLVKLRGAMMTADEAEGELRKAVAAELVKALAGLKPEQRAEALATLKRLEAALLKAAFHAARLAAAGAAMAEGHNAVKH